MPAKPAAPENSFPEEQSKDAAKKPAAEKPAAEKPAAEKPAGEEPPSAPDAPASSGPQAPAAKPGAAAAENPFPEDVSEGAAKAASGDAHADSGSAGGDNTGSSSSSSSSGAGDANADPNADPDAAPAGDVPAHEGRRRLRKPKSSDIQSGSLAGEGRATDDVRVGSYYLTTRNYEGAHLRFAEATKLDPANVEAIYGLAASADGLHKKDEALENYRLYLQVAPDGERAKAAEKALKALAH